MKTSPDPLQPLQKWNELWQFGRASSALSVETRSSFDTRHWEKPRQQAFGWLSRLISKDSDN